MFTAIDSRWKSSKHFHQHQDNMNNILLINLVIIRSESYKGLKITRLMSKLKANFLLKTVNK